MRTVLLVEDNEDIRDMMALALQLAGNTVITASNGQEALNLLHQGPPPCVILLDLMMPVMDGWQFNAAVRRDPRFSDIPIIVLSALAKEMAERLGADDYLPKPIDLDRLLDVVCEHCH